VTGVQDVCSSDLRNQHQRDQRESDSYNPALL
jgi:hypothetical protein